MARPQNTKPTSNKFSRYLILLPAVVGVALYFSSVGHGFVLDDNLVLTSNTHVQKGIAGIGDLFRYNYTHGHSGFNDGLYRPLSLVTFALEKSFFNLSPSTSHFIQTLLYGLLLLVLILWMSKLFPNQKMLAFWVVMLFAVHPIHTEVVANLKGRDDLLALLFFSGSAYAFLKWLDDKKLSNLMVAVVMALGAAFSKESAITFFAIYPLMAWYRSAPLKKIAIGTSIIALPFAGFLIARYAVLSSLDKVDSGVSGLLQNPLLESDSFLERLVTSVKIQGLYIEKLFVPINLSHDYSFNAIPVVGLDDAFGILWIVIVLGLLCIGLFGLLKRNSIGFGILFYFISISVVANFFILIGAMAAERFVFTPSLGWCIAIVSATSLLPKLHSTFNNEKYRNIVLGSIVLVFAGVTLNRIPDWKSNYTLFTADVDKVPQSARAHYNAGSAMNDEARINKREAAKLVPQAREHLKRAIEIWPEYQDAYNNLGISYMNSNEFAEAYGVFERFIDQYPDYSKARYNMAVTCHKLEKYDEAEIQYEAYLEINPTQGDALFFLAECEGYQNKFEEAIEHLLLLVDLEPKRSRGYLKLGMAYAMNGQNVEAETSLTKAMELDHGNPDIHFNLAVFYATTNNLPKAREQLESCLRINPEYTRAKELLSQLSGSP